MTVEYDPSKIPLTGDSALQLRWADAVFAVVRASLAWDTAQLLPPTPEGRTAALRAETALHQAIDTYRAVCEQVAPEKGGQALQSAEHEGR